MSDFTTLVDLANERLGGRVLAANDDFFAGKENLILEKAPVWKEDLYTDRGKWMDGWETRRRREPGHDWCLLRLGLPGIVRGLVVDTSFFRGNFPEAFSLEGAALDADPPADLDAKEKLPGWREIVPRTPLAGDTRNEVPVDETRRLTHVLLRIFPDGGVARLRVFGEVRPDFARLRAASTAGEVDLVAVENGGQVIDASDMFFGSRHNLIYPDPPRGMHDGWETRRRRGPGHDWAILALGLPGTVSRMVVDTSFFKGNAPGSCSLEGTTFESWSSGRPSWKRLLGQQPLEPHHRRDFAHELLPHEAVSHVRFNIFPDGGVARLRLFGHVAPSGDSPLRE